MKFNYLLALGTASVGLLGYYIYKRSKSEKQTKKKIIHDYNTVMKILKKLESDSSIYPSIIQKLSSGQDSQEFREKILSQFVHMVEESKALSCEATEFPLDKFNRILEENKDEPNIKEYLDGFKTMCNVFTDNRNFHPIALPSDFRDNNIVKKIVMELIVMWDKKISTVTEKLCIDSLYCHYEVLSILDTKSINDSDFKELIIRIHNVYMENVLEIARNHNYNYIELYTALAVHFHFRSKMLLFHKACADDIMRTCGFLMTMDKNEEIDINEAIKLFIDTTEKGFRECRDFINKKMEKDESLNYKDFIRDAEFHKYDCYLMHDLWENNKMGEVKTYYDMMYTLKKNYENDDLKTDMFNYSRMINIPYKFIMEYIKINCELEQLGIVRQKSLFVDYNIVQRQAVSLITSQLMDECRSKDGYELITRYMSVLNDKETNAHSEKLKIEIESRSKMLLDLYDIDRETLNIICYLFMHSDNDEIKKWRDNCIEQLDKRMNYKVLFIKKSME